MAIYQRTVHLADTDAAGVVYFAAGLSLCHEAYEVALQEQGIDLDGFLRDGAIAVPIVRGEIDFFRPVVWGDRLQIALAPQSISDSRFRIRYEVSKLTAPEILVMAAQTVHVSIHPQTRQKIPLPPSIQNWIAHQKNKNS